MLLDPLHTIFLKISKQSKVITQLKYNVCFGVPEYDKPLRGHVCTASLQHISELEAVDKLTCGQLTCGQGWKEGPRVVV